MTTKQAEMDTKQEPPSYESSVPSPETRYYLHSHANASSGIESISITLVDPARDIDSQSIYHIAFQGLDNFRMYRGPDSQSRLVAEAKYRITEPKGFDVSFVSGSIAAIQTNDVLKLSDKEENIDSSSSSATDSAEHEEKALVPVTVSGNTTSQAWEVNRKVVPRKNKGLTSNKSQIRENDLGVSLRFLEEDKELATFVNKFTEKEGGKKSKTINEWGYLELSDASAFEKQEAVEMALTTLICVLDINLKVYGIKSASDRSEAGAELATLLLLCSVM